MSLTNPWRDSTETESDLSLAGISLFERNQRTRLLWLIFFLFFALAWFVLFLSGRRLRSSIASVVRSSMQSSVDAKRDMVEMWLDTRKSEAVAFTSQSQVQSVALAQIDGFGTSSNADKSGSDLRQQIAKFDAQAFDGWILLDTHGQVVGSNDASRIGARFELPSATQELIDRAIPTVSIPVWLRNQDEKKDEIPTKEPLVHDPAKTTTIEKPRMLAVAPIMNGARSVGCLAFLIDPAKRFSELISGNSPPGQTVYAFGRNGILYSSLRNQEPLKLAGLMKRDASSTVLAVYARERVSTNASSNGFDRIATQPLTVMADHATRGASGNDISGYQDFRGKKVVGAWHWIARYDMGIALEAECQSVFAPLTDFHRAGLVTLLSLAALLLAGVVAFRRNKLFIGVGARSDGERRRLGKYELRREIGEGGMGRVYLAEHELMQREVAVKVLEGSDATRHSLKRFEREVRMTAQLRHPNTIDIYDYGRTDDLTFFYVMEYIEGISLLELIRDFGPQPPERVIYLLSQVCGSLAEAHSKSMIHRDIKPGNLLITSIAGIYDLVKVVDFGLVKHESNDTVEMTQVASITGTPLYMSPESVRDASMVDPRSDIYSVGAVGYHLLTGLPLFEGENAADICAKQLHEPPIRPSDRVDADLPEDLQNVLMACLRKDPSDRPETANDLAEALMQCSHAGAWTVADASYWWEGIYSATRDETEDLGDNQGNVKLGSS